MAVSNIDGRTDRGTQDQPTFQPLELDRSNAIPGVSPRLFRQPEKSLKLPMSRISPRILSRGAESEYVSSLLAQTDRSRLAVGFRDRCPSRPHCRSHSRAAAAKRHRRHKAPNRQRPLN